MILKAEIKLIFSNAFPKKMVEILEMENDWQEPHIYTRDRKGPLFYFNFFFFEGRFPHLTVKLPLQMRQNLAIPRAPQGILSQAVILVIAIIVLFMACLVSS